MTKNLLLAALLALPAFAGAPATPQNHQCMKDGAVIEKTKKQCKKEGGTWEKIAAKPKTTEPANTPPPPPPAPAN